MKMIINKNPQKYYYGKTNPLKSENPCPLPMPAGYLRNRAFTAYDLLKEHPVLKVKRTQKELQECSRPSFDHPKILHILIDRANGVGAKTLAKGHGGTNSRISRFVQSMGFGVIQPKDRIDMVGRELKKYEREWMKEVRSTSQDVTWANHPSAVNYMAMKKYYADNPIRPTYYSKDEREQRDRYSRRRSARRQRAKPINKIMHNMRNRTRKYLKATGASWHGFGCTSDEFQAHMEKQFTKGMTWDNYGTYWHDDHIRPLASFDLFDAEQRRQADHYTNHQPLEAKKNLIKSDNWDGQTGFDHILG